MHHLIALAVFILACVISLADTLAAPPPGVPRAIHSSPPPAFAPDRILVKFKPGTAASEIDALAQGDRHLRTISGLSVQVLQVPAGTVLDRVALYQRNPNVVYAEPDFYRILIEPNEGTDPAPPEGTGNDHFSDQWALHNTGQFFAIPDPVLGVVEVTGTPDADVDAPEGWDISTGTSSVKIAILDTGIDCRNAGNPEGSLEFPGNKCIEQVNFVSDYNVDELDFLGHGTHVAGIAAAATDNGIGVAGVGWNSSVGSLKTCFAYKYYLYPELEPECGCYQYVGVCPVSASAEAMLYAANNDYHVANMSYASDEMSPEGDPLSYGGYSQTEADAASVAWASGVVLVAAAGNEGTNTQLYPAAYDQVIAVAATDPDDNLPDFSSFGSDWVSLMAPGENIISTVPNEFCVFYAWLTGYDFDSNSDACLDWYSGTSMASPHVAGAAALVWHHLFDGSLSDPGNCVGADGITPCNQVVRNSLENGAEVTGALGQNMQAWSLYGRLSIAGALTADGGAPVVAPSAPGELSVSPDNISGNGVALLIWTFEGDSPESFEILRETIHPKNNRVTATYVTTVAGYLRDYMDDPAEGVYRYSARALLGTKASAWTTMSDPGSIEILDSSAGGDSGGSTGGSGKGGGKPKK